MKSALLTTASRFFVVTLRLFATRSFALLIRY